MRILGLDMGAKKVKAVEVDSAFGRYEIHEYHEALVPEGVLPAHVAQKMIEGLHRKPDRIVTSLLSDQFTFRNLSLPTRDRKTIQSTVHFELEDEVPFSESNVCIDFSVVSSDRNSSQVHVAITQPPQVLKHLEAFKLPVSDLPVAENAPATPSGIEPDVVTSESWAYRSLFNRTLSEEDQKDPVLLVNIGNERSTIYLHHLKSPLLCRPIHWGGNDLTLAICQKYQIPLDQAEKAKIDHGFVLPSTELDKVTAEQNEMSQTLYEPLRELIREIKQAKLSSKTLTHKNLSKIYVCGGTSLLPGINRLLEEELKTPVETFRALSSIAASGVTYTETADSTFLLSLGNALSLVPIDKSPVINFRKGPFTKAGSTQTLNFSSLKRPFQGVSAVAFCLILSMCVQSFSFKRQEQKLDEQLTTQIKKFFPSVSNSSLKTYKSNTASLRTSVKKELDKQRELNKLLSPNPRSPLDFLKELSAGVRKELVVDLMNYEVASSEAAQAKLTFAFSNQTIADQIHTTLSSRLLDLKMSPLEEAPPLPDSLDKKEKRWKATFTGTPKETSYGK